ncbi:MAG: FHA domain-containing protein [Bacteroidales bacterium]|nr:FHA domain-containing protein [Bacteroidales bacterium]
MRRFLFLFLTPFLGLTLFAQPQRGVKGEYNTSNYPQVSFVWNSPDPVVLDRSMFVLTDENGQNIDFLFRVMPQENETYKKSVLFLWEDMKSHRNQSESTKWLLANFFNSTSFDQSTEFNVAVFNRKSDFEKNVLKPLLPEFTSNTDQLVSSVAGYERSTRVFRSDEHPLETDLYLAINEGINMLKKEPSDRVGIIVVVTAGLNMKAPGASTEMETVRKNAVEAGIPIYVVKYYQLAGNTPEVNSLAESTYGQTVMLKDRMISAAVLDLQDIYENLDANCAGQDYRISFTTDAKRDGKPHRLNLSVNKVAQNVPAFVAPNMTFGLWVKEHWFLFIFLLFLLISLIVLAVLLLVHNSKKRKKREAENKAHLQQEIDVAKQDRADWENRQRQQEVEKQREEERKVQEAEYNRLLQLMHTKNMFPRLQCSVDGSSFPFTISQVVTKLGRNKDNDVVLSHQTVSGLHAEIRFNGTSFEVINRSMSYTQGIIVNGQFFQQCTLRSGDMIGLGEAVVTFYV